MKHISFMSIAMVTLLASCSSDMELSQTSEKFDGKVTLSAPAYEYEDGTRTTLTSSESGISFAWDDDETIGIFPIAPTTNAQAYQKLNSGSGDGTKSSFDGAGWALLRGNTYAAYYPFQTTETLDYTKIPIDMTGQTQNGNGSLAHIGAGYDYMYATASVPKNGDVNFDFKHVCSIVKLELTMPVAAAWKSVTLSCDNEVFITKATMNVTTGAVTSVTKSSSVVLNLNNVSTTLENEMLELYLAVLPTSTGDLTVKVCASTNNNYSATLSGITFKAGKAYKLAITPVVHSLSSGNGVENGYEYVDLGLPSGLKWATMNVGAMTPQDYGNYYAWGETELKSIYHYNWDSYKWSVGGSSDTFSKYTTSTKTTLDSEDDAASVNWGGAWRMPTRTEQVELVKNCFWVWTDSYNGTGIAGYIAYKVKLSSHKGYYTNSTRLYSWSDSHIFFPAAGICNGSGSCYNAGTVGWYWSSSLEFSDKAVLLGFSYYPNGCSYNMSLDRNHGLSVRAVCEK